jgi:hypothetical protein
MGDAVAFSRGDLIKFDGSHLMKKRGYVSANFRLIRLVNDFAERKFEDEGEEYLNRRRDAF